MKITMQDITVIVPNGSKVSPSNYQITFFTPNGNYVTLTPKNDNPEATIETDEVLPTLKETDVENETPLTLTQRVEIELDEGRKINAIKEVRKELGCSLAIAKNFVESLLPKETLAETVRDLISANRFDDAMRMVIAETGCTLTPARAFCEAIKGIYIS